jgi:transcription termination factor NusB
LPSVEEKLRVLDAALVALERPGLRAAEISRLHNIIQGVKVYQQLFADFVNYRAIESEVLELRKQFAADKSQS